MSKSATSRVLSSQLSSALKCGTSLIWFGVECVHEAVASSHVQVTNYAAMVVTASVGKSLAEAAAVTATTL